MDKKELLKEFEAEFETMRAELGFSATLDELDDVFFLRDFIMGAGFLSTKLSRMLTGRMKDTINQWNSYFHALVMPNPSNMINLTESKMFSEEEKKAMIPYMNHIIELASRNTLIGLTKNKKAEAKWFDDCLAFWNDTFKEEAIRIMKKTNSSWAMKVQEEKVEI